MRTAVGWRYGYRSIQFASLLCVVGLALCGVFQRIDPANPPSWLALSQPVLANVKVFSAAIVLPALGGLLGALQAAKKLIGHPNTWRQVQAILDQLQATLFGAKAKPHEHRVTLMKHRRFVWRCGSWRQTPWWWPWGGRLPWSGWLVPISRSGFATKKTQSAFLAPDDADHAEGIAGATWQLSTTGVQLPPVENLCDLSEASSTDERKDYAARAYCSDSWIEWVVRTKRRVARSYAGRPVEVSGRPWGVIVIDSRNPTLPSPDEIDKATRWAAKLLDAVLRGS